MQRLHGVGTIFNLLSPGRTACRSPGVGRSSPGVGAARGSGLGARRGQPRAAGPACRRQRGPGGQSRGPAPPPPGAANERGRGGLGSGTAATYPRRRGRAAQSGAGGGAGWRRRARVALPLRRPWGQDDFKGVWGGSGAGRPRVRKGTGEPLGQGVPIACSLPVPCGVPAGLPGPGGQGWQLRGRALLRSPPRTQRCPARSGCEPLEGGLGTLRPEPPRALSPRRAETPGATPSPCAEAAGRLLSALPCPAPRG